MKVKIGVIGCGAHANAVHYPSLASMPDVEIAAICDLNRARLEATGDKYSVKHRFTSYVDMLERVELDAVYVIMPPHHLYDVVADCLEYGVDVFVEKPPGVTAYQTRSLALLAKRRGCRTMVGFNRRFIPLVRKARRLVEKHGPIIQCVSTFYKHALGWRPPYYRGAVDVLTCDAIHAVDMLRWMGGEVKSVVSLVDSFYADWENAFNAIVKFRNGAVGVLLTNWAVGGRIHRFEMHSRGASATVDPDDRAVIVSRRLERPLVITTQEAAGSGNRIRYYGFYDENRHFIECVREDVEPETCFSDAVKTMELVEEIYRCRIG